MRQQAPFGRFGTAEEVARVVLLIARDEAAWDLADLYRVLLETESPPGVVNGIASILPWPEVMGAVAQAASSSGDPETITPDEAAMLGGPAIYMPIDMAVSGELAKRRLGWQPQGPDFETDLLALQEARL